MNKYHLASGIDVRVVNKPCRMRTVDPAVYCSLDKKIVLIRFKHRNKTLRVSALVCDHQKQMYPQSKHWSVDDLIAWAEVLQEGGDWQDMHDRLSSRVKGLPKPYKKPETRPGKGRWKEWDGPMKKKLEDLSKNSFTEDVWDDSISDYECDQIARKAFPGIEKQFPKDPNTNSSLDDYD